MKISAPVIFIFLLFSAIPAFASQFQPIKEITDFEIEIIANTIKRPPDKDKIIAEVEKTYNEKIEYFSTIRNLVILKFQNGDEGYYAFGENATQVTTEQRDNKKTEQISTDAIDLEHIRKTAAEEKNVAENSKDESSQPKTVEEISKTEREEESFKIYEEINEIDKKLIHALGLYDENEADHALAKMYAKDIVEILLKNKDVLHNWQFTQTLRWLASGGNNFLPLAEETAMALGVDDTSLFYLYESYLTAYRISKNDLFGNTPSDKQKREILKKMSKLYLAAKHPRPIVNSQTVNEIIRLDIVTFQKMGLSCAPDAYN